jgi:hypothetical protein
MSLKQRLLIVITSDLFVRNYLTTDALTAIQSQYDCQVASARSVSGSTEKIPGFAGYFDQDPEIERRHYNLLNVLTWAYRNASSSFRLRFMRIARAELLIWRGDLQAYVRNVAKFFAVNLLRDRWPLYALVCGTRRLLPLFLRAYSRHIPIHPSVTELLERTRPILVICPSGAHDPGGIDFIRAARQLGIKTLFLIDNWDNLSSKSIFWVQPDFLAVWGEQSRDHAERIHGIGRERVFPVGTPRFDGYFRALETHPTSPFAFEYVLFTGCAIPFDEVTALQRLEAEIAADPALYGGLRIVYRPHPWRQLREREPQFVESEFRHVVLDPQLREAFLGIDKTCVGDKHLQPALDYYPGLLANARFVVAPLTTMVLEAAILKRHVLTLVYDDGIHLTSPHNAWRYFEHFRGLESVAGLRFCTNCDVLGDDFRTLFQVTGISSDVIGNGVEHFLHCSTRPYPQRLADVVATAISRESAEIRNILDGQATNR